MKNSGQILAWMLCTLATTTTAHALTERSNPYERIVERNIFRLKSPALQQADPPQSATLKIELQGITSIFGLQVLFKIHPSSPGDKERSYILSKGQREDEVEVLEIDERDGSVKFNNHGIIQTLKMDKDASKPSNIASASQPGILRRIPTLLPTSTGNVARANTIVAAASRPVLTHEEQMIMIEVERERTKAQVEAGEQPPLTPTELTPQSSK